MNIDDAVFRRKIAESGSADERNRASENKRGRWDQPDSQINNSEDHWERMVDRARNQRRCVYIISVVVQFKVQILSFYHIFTITFSAKYNLLTYMGINHLL